LLLAAAAGHDDVVAYLPEKGGREAVDTKYIGVYAVDGLPRWRGC